MIGVRANVSVGEMRSFGVQVTGEVRRRGNLSVSGLDTITSALYRSGGITPIGSLRNVQLKRQGAIVGTLDLYDLLLRGNSAGDLRLQPGDVIFVPPVGPTVKIDGEVKRPAIYELRGNESAASVLEMAGGLATEADPARSSVTRIDDQYRRVVLNIDFSRAESRVQLLRGGDELRIARLRPQLDSGVMLDGFVHRPGLTAWREGLRLSDVIGSIDELKPQADPNYVLIRRESGADRRVEAFGPDLVAALAQRGGVADVVLAPRDVITVFDLAPGRERIIKPLLGELQLQAGTDRAIQIVRVEGRVKAPGEYPLESGMTVSDLLRAGGGMDASAYRGTAELTRAVVDSNGVLQVSLVDVNLAAMLRGDAAADILLQPSDSLLIKETPDWSSRLTVTLRGEVHFPGTYTISRGETLYDVIQQRAGGLTSRAFAKGSVFTRVSLQEREQKQLDQLADRMQIDLATMSLRTAAANQQGASQTFSVGNSLLTEIRETRAVGRLVINLQGLMEEGKSSEKNVLLRDGDVLMVPSQAQEVTVIGEVQTVTSHLYDSALSREDYIAKSGGATRQADLRKMYVVRADGSVLASKGGLLNRNFNVAIQPGDTIVVPLNTERMPRLPFWQAVTQIVYNLAISVAAINSF
jgi:protein involved in polysaccharide export with SLBB domain